VFSFPVKQFDYGLREAFSMLMPLQYCVNLFLGDGVHHRTAQEADNSCLGTFSPAGVMSKN
jgi:hypothetical protein